MLRVTRGGGGLLVLAALGVAFAALKLYPSIGENGFQWVAGGVIFATDLTYRALLLRPRSETEVAALPTGGAVTPVAIEAASPLNVDLGKHWLTGGGPRIAFLPAWLFGLLWPLLVVVSPG